MTSSEFDLDTAVGAARGDETPTTLSGGWHVGGGLNGGYLMAVACRALLARVPAHPHPLVVSAHYLATSSPGPAIVRSTVLREGRSTATASATIEQGGRPTVALLATLGTLGDSGEEDLVELVEPDLLPVEDCLSAHDIPDTVLSSAPFMERVALRADPRYNGWIQGRPTGRAEIRSWLRLRDGREPDPLSLLLAADALPPVTFEQGRMGWAPTLEITVHLRGLPAPGWLKVTHRSQNMSGGLFEEDCEVWDSRGRLVVQSRQLARQPRS